MSERTPVTTAEELWTLDSDEVIEGYRSGRAGEPEPGNNRSKAYWHGWRNGMIDGHHMKPDAASAALVRVVAPNGVMRERPLPPPPHNGV